MTRHPVCDHGPYDGSDPWARLILMRKKIPRPMSKVYLPVLLCLSVLAMASVMLVGGVSADEEDPEPEPITSLQGFVYELPAQENKRPIAGVTVTTWMTADSMYETAVTDLYGSFIVEYNPDIRFISFSMAEYTVQDWWHELHKSGDTGLFEIRIDDGSNVNGVHSLFGNSKDTVLIARTNASVYGTVTSEIDGKDTPIEGVHITLSSSKTTVSTVTDQSGFYSISCASGVLYHLTADKGGFIEWETNDVDPSSDEPVNIDLVQKTHTYLFGMDLVHTLGIFGLLLIFIVAIIGVYMAKRPEKEDGIYILNDIPAPKPKNGKKVQ